MSKDTRDYIPHGGKHLMTANGGEGYEKLDDKIWPAPGSARTMCEIVDRQTGLDAYIQSMNRYVVEQFRVLAADKRRWWDWAVKAYGLDSGRNYQWNPVDQRIELAPVDTPVGKEEAKGKQQCT
jgi:hypothetical protein